MPAALAVVFVLLALVAAGSPYAIHHVARDLHARRHAACLARIAELEWDLGIADALPPRRAMRTAQQAAVHWQWARAGEAVDRYAEAVRRHHGQTAIEQEREKAWAANRKRLAAIPRERGKGRR